MVPRSSCCGINLALLLCGLWLYPALAAAGNNHPIVLVHGFTGWGPDEMGGFNYWGGKNSIARMLTTAGKPTYTGVVGPVSSNWDRACELYAYIKGGRVDYGAAHAARFQHARYGRTFPGLLRDWGESTQHARIHLVGHSQGGQTARVLTSLLANGDEHERRATMPEDLNPLFQGGREWVHSVTTLSTPHDGSTLATILAGEADHLLGWLLALASYLGHHYREAPSYDFKLDQWQLAQGENESDQQFRQRLQKSNLWRQDDIATWDLRPAGAKQLNARYPAVGSTYYFSWATQDSVPAPGGRRFVPAVGMNLVLMSTSLAIGEYLDPEPGPGLPAFDQFWWPNDGVVNTLSMSGPRIGSTDHIINMSEGQAWAGFMPGVWYFMGVLQGWDHLDIIGQQTRLDVRSFYLQLAALLASLPEKPVSGTPVLPSP